MKANPHCAAHLQASGVSGNWSWRTARHALALFLLPLLSAIHVPGQQLSLDFGDAPRPYPTLLSEDGARHATSRGFHLGSNVDLEPDGQPEQFARGDDQNPAGAAPDEDGVIFNTPLEPGAVAEVDVIAASGGGRLDAWMDFNGDGDWADANEQIFRSVLLGAGSNLLRFTIPSDALNGPAFVRFRLSAQGGLKPTGFASEGEVEDYAVFIGKQSEPLDFGDAPQGYPTVLSDNGARHNLVQGFSLGKLADPESDGQPDSFALGDDTKPSPDIDDEDGVVFLSPMVAGQPVDVEVTCELGDGNIDAWIDFNQDRDWNDPGEQIFAQLLQPGANRLRFIVPANAAPGETFARFRLSFEGKLQPTGPAQSGEVEDYLVKIEGAKVELDFGDAPESYPTRLAQDGARHVINPDFFLGRLIDPEADGQPSAGADGDDLNPSATADDEDGVRFISPLLLGKPADVEVTFVGGQGRLDAWIDFNANGNWNDPGEQIFANQPLVSGPNQLTFAVPPNAAARESYARFRLSLQGGLKPNGPASEGEVEDYVVKIEKPAELDFGDAPESYPTLLAQDGARHVINPDFFLGRLIDPEADGQPSAGADGDDLNPSATAGDDEDGVRFISPLLLGKPADVEVTFVGGQGRLDAWIDFNANGNWNDPGEQIFANQPLVSGPNHLTFAVPPNAVARESYARFRLSLQGGLKPNGPASEGEVEDYVVKIEKPAELDFGDAPQSYPTLLAQDGARHVINPDFFLGRLIDPEADGQPSAGADGDDLNPSATAGDDEDGVRFITSPLLAGKPAEVEVTLAGSRGQLDAWIDFNGDGDWNDPGEQIFTSKTLVTGPNVLAFAVPPDAVPRNSYARFRLSLQGGLKPNGPASEGEVEDYVVKIEKPAELDFGDAPQSYATLLAQDGARHVINPDFFLGRLIDPEADGQPSVGADGDDLNPSATADDEDGVRFISPLLLGKPADVEVTFVGGQGRLDAWIDFNANGSWNDPGEQIFTNQPLVSGPNHLTFTVPPNAVARESYARFRLSLQGGLKPNGPASEGEVEDYVVKIEKPAELDFSDAPQSYPTLLVQDGARHLIRDGFHLGRLIDAEPDGQPTAPADGDDLNPSANADDEDGVRFVTSPLVAGSPAEVEVVLSAGEGRLDAWVDFNANGNWNDPGEQIFTAKLIVAGPNLLTFAVPAEAAGRPTYARFRLSLQGGMKPNGAAPDGEVEDYLVNVERPPGDLDFGDAPRPYPTLLVQDGARHQFRDKFHLGRLIDLEKDGQPNGTATGDDITPARTADDEDGVRFVTNPLRAGQTAEVEVVATAEGLLDAWIDFNGDSDWADAGEKIFAARPLSPGLNTLHFTVPTAVVAGDTFSRFRFSSKGGLNFVGLAEDGEVEDYGIRVSTGPDDCDDRTSEGSDFWLTFPGNYAPDADNPVHPKLCIVGVRETTGLVEIPGLSFTHNFVIPGSGHVVVELPRAADLGDANDVIENKGIHVTANRPVAVYGLSKVDYTTDGYLALPTATLGRRYLIQSYQNIHTGIDDLNGTQFALVATEDGTTVFIRPSVETEGHAAGVVYTLTMNRGETYQLRNRNDAPADLSGTLVASDKPIAVFGSHQCANLPSNNTFFCDYLVEHLVPIERAGTLFFAVPLKNRTNGDTYRFWALADDTVVRVNGVVVATIDRYEFHEQLIFGRAKLTSNKPMLVNLYANSADHDLPPAVNADPFMVVLPHAGQFLSQQVVCTPDEGFTENYLNVIAPNAVVGTLTLDGAAVPAAQFQPIPGSGYSGAQLSVTPGAHRLAAGLPFAVIAYGWAEYESYGFPAGMYFGDTRPPEVVCNDDPIEVVLTAQSTCFVPVPDRRDGVIVDDNCKLPDRVVVRQDPAPGTLVGPGKHIITVSATDAHGNVGFCEIEFNVIDPSPIILNCPKEVTARCKGPEGTRVFYEVTARKRCEQNIQIECVPPPGSLFPEGTTIVSCTATDAFGNRQTCTFPVTVRCPIITATLTSPNQATLSWSQGRLESAPSVTGPWSVVPNAVSPYTAELTSGQGYYRVIPPPQ